VLIALIHHCIEQRGDYSLEAKPVLMLHILVKLFLAVSLALLVLHAG